jgi:hypothetical protein
MNVGQCAQQINPTVSMHMRIDSNAALQAVGNIAWTA